MKLGIVKGQIVATRKDERLVGSKLMLVQPVNHALQPAGEMLLAVDTVGAGVGETVFFSLGSAASRALRSAGAPVDCAIIGIVDQIDIQP